MHTQFDRQNETWPPTSKKRFEDEAFHAIVMEGRPHGHVSQSECLPFCSGWRRSATRAGRDPLAKMVLDGERSFTRRRSRGLARDTKRRRCGGVPCRNSSAGIARGRCRSLPAWIGIAGAEPLHRDACGWWGPSTRSGAGHRVALRGARLYRQWRRNRGEGGDATDAACHGRRLRGRVLRRRRIRQT